MITFFSPSKVVLGFDVCFDGIVVVADDFAYITVSYILLEFIIRDVFSCRTTFIGQVQPQQHHRYNHIQPVQVELGHIHFIGIFFVGGFMTMSGAGWGASLFGGGCFSLVFGLICHAVITLRRNDK